MKFRPLTDDDIEMMHRWLNEPGIVRWWEGEDVSLPAVQADYGSGRADQETENFIALLDGTPIGWICCWPVLTGLEESGAWMERGLPDTAVGIDYLIAAPDRRGQGLGSTMIRAFVDDVVFAAERSWTHAAASPYTANAASCRALEKAGFELVDEIQYDADDGEGPCSLLVISQS